MKRAFISTCVLYWVYLSTISAAAAEAAAAGAALHGGTEEEHGNRQQRGLGSAGSPWKSTKDFPIPNDGVGDPDNILSTTARQNLADKLASLHGSKTLTISSPRGTSKSESDNQEKDVVPVQMAVAIVERLAIDDVTTIHHRNDGSTNIDIDGLVERFATTLHDQWGVGYETTLGGTGVLIFLDVYDRVVYISRGGALVRILTDSRIDTIIHGMKHPLRQAKYEEGLTLAINSIAELIEKGEASFWESFKEGLFQTDILFLLVWALIFCNAMFQSWKQKRDQVAYARAASQLSELDRAHAQALQGNYQATSCPICLENFISSTVGSDGEPIKLLRCGHVFDESCWAEWVKSGRGDVTKCPVCRMDIGPRSDDGGESMEPAPTETAVDGPTSAPNTTADQDVDASDEPTSEVNNGSIQENGSLLRNRGNALWEQLIPSSNNNGGGTTTRRTSQQNQENNNDFGQDNRYDGVAADRERAMRLYQRERNFRLLRLSQMYPRYISPNQVSRWTSPTYDGSSLSRDPSFANSDPGRQQHTTNGRSNNPYGNSRGFGGGGGGGFSFGGGTSAGGRSGRF